ncbi:MAG TPA: tRNA (adenosine(37)-N6)-threonylcarbamoyltransferase complex ATPase subunit type 1 TsaE [Burkholderiaceae bacterium]|nr:tRNA (adenosine(37)-N6)-threonylcarbamoyltransferase complex ATPase subunit type 1 TsaE [Burkholderiaceae bacterium]
MPLYGKKMVACAHFELPDEGATERAGRALGGAIAALETTIERDGLVIGLSGDLGAGKTAWVRAALRALGILGPVKSPSFSLLEVYVVSRLNFYHFDFYRLKEPSEFALAGFREHFGPGAVCAIEWPERADGYLPEPDVTIELSVRGAGRQAAVSHTSSLGESCLKHLTAELPDLLLAPSQPIPNAGA